MISRRRWPGLAGARCCWGPPHTRTGGSHCRGRGSRWGNWRCGGWEGGAGGATSPGSTWRLGWAGEISCTAARHIEDIGCKHAHCTLHRPGTNTEFISFRLVKLFTPRDVMNNVLPNNYTDTVIQKILFIIILFDVQLFIPFFSLKNRCK